jgi:hypothetical protein
MNDDNLKRTYSKYFFMETITTDHINYAVLCLKKFESILMTEAFDCMHHILIMMKVQPPYYLENKLMIIKRFIPYISYTQTDELLSIFQMLTDNIKNGKIGLLVCNMRPVSTILQMLDASNEI